MRKKLVLLFVISAFLTSCSFSFPDSSEILSDTTSEESSVIDSTSYDSSTSSSTSSNSEDVLNLWDHSQDSLRNGTKTLDFYSLNDFHGAVENSSSEPGICKMSSFLLNRKKLNTNGFVLTSSGDMWQGSADSNITRGRLVTDWMNYLKFDAMAIGNHEFDWGISTINSNQERMNFPLLACNIVYEDTNENVEWLDPYTTITRNGVHIGVIGAIGKGQTSDILASNVEGIRFNDPSPYVSKWSKYLRDNGADVILYLIHDNASTISSVTASEVDLGFCGHTHSFDENLIGDTPFVQGGSNGKGVGHINLNYNFNNKQIVTNGEYINTGSISYADDTYTANLYKQYLDDEIAEVKNRVVGYTSSKIYKNEIPNIYNRYAYKYYKDTLKGNQNIFAVYTNNARSDIPSGNITYGNIYKALPFDNYLCLFRVKGSYISTLTRYENSHWYIPSSSDAGEYYRTDVASLAESNKDYYILTIDYIALSTSYVGHITILETHFEEESLPRNIVANYISGYPSNLS